MAKLTKAERTAIANELLRHIKRGPRGKQTGTGTAARAVCSYQLFNLLSPSAQGALVGAYGPLYGKGAKEHHTPANAIAAIIRNHINKPHQQVLVTLVRSAGMHFADASGTNFVPAGYSVTAFYSTK